MGSVLSRPRCLFVSGRSRQDKCKIVKGQQDILKKYLFQYKTPMQSQ